MVATIKIEGGINIGTGVNIGQFPVIGFTMSPADITFTTVQAYSGAYSSETSAGFTANADYIVNGVQYSTTGTTATQIANALGLLGNDPFVWTVTWTTGGITQARVTLDGGNYITIAPIDTSFPNWQTTSISTTPTLPGTYTFPAIFSLYNPQTDLNNGGTGWC
jgi:hypothetical protein